MSVPQKVNTAKTKSALSKNQICFTTKEELCTHQYWKEGGGVSRGTVGWGAAL